MRDKRNISKLSKAAFCGFLFIFCQIGAVHALSPSDAENHYQSALKLAHEGKPLQALPMLEQLMKSFPQNQRYLYDFLLVSLWAGKPQQVLRYRQRLNFQTSPDYVLETLGQAARDQKKFRLAEKAYRQLIHRHPENWRHRVKLSQVLVDQQKIRQAKTLLAKLEKKHSSEVDFQSVLHYLIETERESKHQQALQLARQGKTAQALEIIETEIKQYPQQKRYFFDYLQILFWEGQYQSILKQSEQLNLEEVPDFVLKVIALSARYEKRFERAEHCWELLIKRMPLNDEYKIGLAAVLIDQYKITRAKTMLQAVLKKDRRNIEALKVLAYLYEQEENFIKAAATYERVLQLQLNDKEAIRGLVFSLSQGRFFNQAWEAALLHRQYFSDSEWLKLYWDLAANLIRWGEIPAAPKEYRYALTHQAITRIHENLNMLENMDLPETDRRTWWFRAQFDLLVALRDAKQMHKVLNTYAALKDAGVKIPAYSKIAAADAFLYLQQPEKARDLYLDVLKEIPGNYNARQSLVYAYLESEQFDRTNHLAKIMAAEQPKKLWFKKPGDKKLFYSRGNPRKTETELAVAVMEAFSDRLEQAMKKVDFLYRNAPFNTDIRQARANIYYYRGWPRSAYRQLVAALNIDPKHLGNRTSLSRVLHDLRRYREEQKNTDALYSIFYEDKGVQRQKRLWGIHNLRELKIFARGGFSKTHPNSTSNNTVPPVNGSEFISLDSYLFSQPLAYQYRLFTHVNWQTSKFDNGLGLGQEMRGYFRRYGLGLEWSQPDFIATGEVHYDSFRNGALGFKGTLDYQFNDLWSSGFTVDTRSNAIGLRALNAGATDTNIKGVNAYSFTAYTAYRIHESRRFTLSHQLDVYNDDNVHYGAGFTYYERWFSSPNYKFGTYLSFDTSLNTRQTGNYYHPENDHSGTITFDNNILTYRYYDTTFHQNIALSAGYYWQKEIRRNQPTRYHFDPVGSIQYEHRWKTMNRYELIYGATRRFAVYDGDRTNSWQFYLTLNVRF